MALHFSFPWDQADLTIQLPRSKWAQSGVTYPDGRALPNDNLPASLLLPMGRTGPAFLAYPNFAAYTEWAAAAGEKHPFSRTLFGRMLTDRYTKVKGRDVARYVGLKLRKPPVAGQRPAF